MSLSLTLFTFGYWGWGTATAKLVAAIDAVEVSRGFAPPMFVDIRASRSVRAPGFNGATFERQVGGNRYRSMPELGNEAKIKKLKQHIKIVDPAAAPALLELARDVARDHRRVIFFCACEEPRREGDGDECHRTTVAGLVLKAAKKTGIQTTIVEWPGGEPVTCERKVTPEIWSKLVARVGTQDGLKNLPIGRRIPGAEWLALPWGSIVAVSQGLKRLAVVSGPARFARGVWQLPVLEVFDRKSKSDRELREESSAWRESIGWDSRSSQG